MHWTASSAVVFLVFFFFLLVGILVLIAVTASLCLQFPLLPVNVLIHPPAARSGRSKANVSVTYFFRNQKFNVPTHWSLGHPF